MAKHLSIEEKITTYLRGKYREMPDVNLRGIAGIVIDSLYNIRAKAGHIRTELEQAEPRRRLKVIESFEDLTPDEAGLRYDLNLEVRDQVFKVMDWKVLMLTCSGAVESSGEVTRQVAMVRPYHYSRMPFRLEFLEKVNPHRKKDYEDLFQEYAAKFAELFEPDSISTYQYTYRMPPKRQVLEKRQGK